jgi:2,3-bisphosphoglycerate-dependent phosphoglycerate mutase
MAVDFQRPFSPPPGSREVVLVRHGSVTQPPQEDGPPRGSQNDPPLDERGRAQAAAAAARLEEEPIAAIFVTTLARTVQTAAPLLAVRGEEAEVIEELREIELGAWEHGELLRRALAGDPEFERVMEAQRWDLIPGAERADAFAERVRRGLERAADAAGDDGVAVAFTHSAVIAEVCRQVTGSEPFAFLAVSNCSLTRLVRIPGGRWVLVAFNETAHLPLEWQPRRRRG